VAKIVATSFVRRYEKLEPAILGRPKGWFKHAQSYNSEISIIDIIDKNVYAEVNVCAGAYCDLIFINNDSGFDIGRKYLESINGKETRNGKVKVFHRENFGRAFSAYNFAYDTLRSDYDYFIFTEDDIIIDGHFYAYEAIKSLLLINNLGFFAYVGINMDRGNEYSFGQNFHAQEGVGMAHKSALDIVINRYGELPNWSDINNQSFSKMIDSEIAFTNSFIQCGMQIIELDPTLIFHSYSYHINKKIPTRRYVP
jgi:hypothetical protein